MNIIWEVTPEFLESLDDAGCEIVIRHEIRHKAIYKELGRMDLYQ